jgi:hypothetical protein
MQLNLVYLIFILLMPFLLLTLCIELSLYFLLYFKQNGRIHLYYFIKLIQYYNLSV